MKLSFTEDCCENVVCAVESKTKKTLSSSTIETYRFILLSDAGGARARRRRDSPLHLQVTAVSPSALLVRVFVCCFASISPSALFVTTHPAHCQVVLSSVLFCVVVSLLGAWFRAGSVQPVSKLAGSVRFFMAMETLPLTRVKSLPPPSDLSFTSLTLITCRRASSTGIPIFHQRGRPVTTTTTTTTPCALLLCFFHALILEPGSPFVTLSQPPQHVKYSTPTGLTTTASSSDASYTDGALVGTICQRKTLILVGLMGLGLATRLVDLIDLGLVSRSSVTNLFFNRYRFFHSWTWAVCLNKITKSPPNTGSPSRPCPLVDTPSPKVFSYGLQQFPPYESTSCFVVSISIMELEMMLGPSGSPYVSLNMFSDVYEIHIVFSGITDGDRAVCLLDYLVSSSFSPGCSAPLQTHSLGCINVVYDYVKLVGALVSGIQVKIIQGLLHFEQASPTNNPILRFNVLFVVHPTVEINSGCSVSPSISPVVTT